MKGSFAICGLLASCVAAHMQMSKPFPIRSPLNENASGQVDWSYTNPLSTDGSDFPCKGYADDPFHSVASYAPGEEYTMELEGSATHGGGSCQLSLSYDNAKTFRVIRSMLGDCPIQKKYSFQIPSDAPSGKALFTWTWFNRIGNREMYMNCAQVTIKDGSSKREHPRDLSPSLVPRSALDDLPPIFIANVDGPGQCTTIGGEAVNFPLPGSNVRGDVSGKGYKCKADAPFLGDGSPGGSGSSSSTSTSSTSTASKASASSSSMTSSSMASSAVPMSSASVSASASASSSASASASASPSSSKAPSSFGTQTSVAHVPPTPPAGSCQSGAILCASDGKSFSMCAHGEPIFMGPVAAGTQCKNGRIVYA